MSLLTSNILSSLLSKIKAQLDAKAPKSHAATGTTYGVGNNTKYGHLKLSSSLTSVSGYDGGIAATPYAVKSVNDKVNTITNNITTLTNTVANKADAEDLYNYVPLEGWANSKEDKTSSSPYFYGYLNMEELATDVYNVWMGTIGVPDHPNYYAGICEIATDAYMGNKAYDTIFSDMHIIAPDVPEGYFINLGEAVDTTYWLYMTINGDYHNLDSNIPSNYYLNFNEFAYDTYFNNATAILNGGSASTLDSAWGTGTTYTG